jgi:2,4-dienoyl-CoA reductase-like NADH-dependent reductase (Old Yellow Enzyme family)
MEIKKIAALKTPAGFRDRTLALGLDLPIEDGIQKSPESPLAQSKEIGGFTVGNRYCIHPMEGWDATLDGKPTPDLTRRWVRFGESGAKFLWGMEAMAVRPDGRANPNQLILSKENAPWIRAAAEMAVESHRRRFGNASDLLWGYQLTHSGRFSRPRDKHRLEPALAYRHPLLNPRFHLPDDHPMLSDDDIKRLIEDYVSAARLAEAGGVPFVDVKQCHGYLGHEFLSAFTRPGPYGGESLEERSRFAREIIQGIRQVAPKLIVGVRLSAFDWVPFRKGGDSDIGVPEDFSRHLPYRYGFGVRADNPLESDLSEPIRYLRLIREWGVSVVNVSCGSPYYNPHIQRPALYPPSDGYQPPEDPLVGVARQVATVHTLKRAVPEMPLVGSGLTYLQELLPQVAQAVVRQGYMDFAGIGRMVLSYPAIVSDSLEKGALETRRICRTFSDCTTAPRNGMKSGCLPLDEYYKSSPEFNQLKAIKQAERGSKANSRNAA